MAKTISDHTSSKAAFLEHLASSEVLGAGHRAVETRIVGNRVWQLIETGGRRWINLQVITGKNKGTLWGSTSVSESEEPPYFDCPQSLIDKASEPSSAAAQRWREANKQAHQARTTMPKVCAGMVVTHAGQRFKLIEPAGSRMGWVVERLDDLVRFRMPTSQLIKAAQTATEA